MLKKAVFLSVSLLLLISCYPLGTFQGPDVLPEGEETLGMGLSWMTNIIALQDTSSGKEEAFMADASLLFRRGFAHNTEIGIKFVGRPWVDGALLTDVKWQVIQQPIEVSLDFGLSYWTRPDIYAFIGYHPAIIAGSETFFGLVQYNYIRSRSDVVRTSDLMFGRHIRMKDSNYTLTPLLGFHLNEEQPKNLYYSLGLGFSGPLDDWAKP